MRSGSTSAPRPSRSRPQSLVRAHPGGDSPAIWRRWRPRSLRRARAFSDDVAAFPPAREIYERNTEAATRRVRELIDEGRRDGAFRNVDSAFVAEVVTASMRRITSGELTTATGLDDAAAYRELAKLVLAAVRR